MTNLDKRTSIFIEVSTSYPHPIAAVCKKFIDSPPVNDDWKEWGILSRDILITVLKYISHLLLSDLVATGKKPSHLFHRIQSILSRPLTGHYIGFLSETAKYSFKSEDIKE